jgi:hypothetical protein
LPWVVEPGANDDGQRVTGERLTVADLGDPQDAVEDLLPGLPRPIVLVSPVPRFPAAILSSRLRAATQQNIDELVQSFIATRAMGSGCQRWDGLVRQHIELRDWRGKFQLANGRCSFKSFVTAGTFEMVAGELAYYEGGWS